MASTTTYLRMVGYILTIVMHVGNVIYLNMCMKPELLQDPMLFTFTQLQSRYFTVWTFSLQVIHAWVGLICDCLLICNSKKKVYKLPKHLKGFKNILFSAILWPSTWVVFTHFWVLYLYDRSLVYPQFVDQLLTTTSNHIMHTFIIGVVLWEVCFLPRVEPKSHWRNIAHLLVHLLVYFALLIYTYIERGIWVYPILGVLYGTALFPMIPLPIGGVALTAYHAQWSLTNYFWPSEAKSTKIR